MRIEANLDGSDATSRKGTDLGFESAKETQVRYPKLDIADPASIQSLAKSIEKDHKKLDVLINNAGVNLDDDYNPQNVKTTLDTNVRGTLRVGVLSTNGEWEAKSSRCAKLSFPC